MRKLLLAFLFISIAVFSCRKDSVEEDVTTDFLSTVKLYLKQSLSAPDYERLNFAEIVRTRVADGRQYIVRVPMIPTGQSKEYVVLKTNSMGSAEAGKIISISKLAESDHNEGIDGYNGAINIQTLQRQVELKSDIVNGYIVELHRKETVNMMAPPEPAYGVLPEVVVVGHINSGGGISYADWMRLQGLFAGTQGGYYFYLDGSVNGGRGRGSNGIPESDAIEMETEYIDKLPGLNVSKIFNCFTAVPSAGAVYVVKLCADIPANNSPTTSASSSKFSAGHTFLTITKSNGGVSVTQSFGFYPADVASLINPLASVQSEVKDNGGQEINASISMSISESQFEGIRQKAIALAGNPYNLVNFNCSNYAIDIFNSARTTPLDVAALTLVLPGTTLNSTVVNKTPHALFVKLQEMKNKNDPEAASIKIDQTHQYTSALSKGECN